MLKMKTNGPLWDVSTTPPKIIRFIGADIPLEEITRPDGNWVQVNAHFPLSVDPLPCWVLAKDVITDDSAPSPLNLWAFLKYCTLASVVANEGATGPVGVNRDYLIALAQVLSGVQNIPSPDKTSDAFGPFQLTKDDWTKFRNQGDNRKSYSELDRLDSLEQVDAIVALTSAAASDISAALTVAGTGSGPYVPDGADLFLAYMIGTPAAIAALKAQQAKRGGEALATFITNAGGSVDAIKKRYPTFLADAAATVDAVVAIVEQQFNVAFKTAFTLLQTNTPEDLPQASPIAAGTLWLDVARHEEAAGIARPNDRILDYFKAINFHGATVDTPWCAAFVSFCLKTCGDAAMAGSVPSRDPALAKTWREWGDGLPIGAASTPVGAVVVLSAVESDSSGHVGFFLDGDADSVRLLGGNQSHSVKISTYRRGQIAAIRWPSQAGPAEAHRFNLSVAPAGREDIAEMIIGKFRDAGFGLFQQAAAVANAIAESNLVPTAHATHGEDSVGLFQLNRNGGVGTRFSVAELADPATNIKITIDELKTKYPAFGAASSLEDAVTVFVRKFERPANTAAEIVKRLNLAQHLLA